MINDGNRARDVALAGRHKLSSFDEVGADFSTTKTPDRFIVLPRVKGDRRIKLSGKGEWNRANLLRRLHASELYAGGGILICGVITGLLSDVNSRELIRTNQISSGENFI